MKNCIIGIMALIMIATLGYAARRPLTPEQRIAIRKQQAEEYRKGVESGQIRPSRFAERQQRTRPQKPGDIGYKPPTSRLIAIAVDEKYCYVIDNNGQLSKIAKANIRADYKR